jgi:shikimate dehydrogenase
VNWRLGVVGSPIAHSLSPVLHEAGLALAGLAGHSTRLEVGLDGAARLREIVLERFDAVSVTAPLKGRAVEVCDALTEVARRTGSVNAILVRDGLLEGNSTDGAGFVDALEARFGPSVAGAHAVVLGAGGAARAVVDALVEGGVASVSVLARRAEAAEDLAARYSVVHPSTLVYRPVDLVVNTVPAGARAPSRSLLQGVGAQTIAVDLAYEPKESAWLALHRAHGCRTQNGLAMLAYTAARLMSWWWGVPLDGAALVEVLR